MNLSSVAERTARPGNAVYAATKWGVNGWSEPKTISVPSRQWMKTYPTLMLDLFSDRIFVDGAQSV